MEFSIVYHFVYLPKEYTHIFLYNNINKKCKYILFGYETGWILIRYPYLLIFTGIYSHLCILTHNTIFYTIHFKCVFANTHRQFSSILITWLLFVLHLSTYLSNKLHKKKNNSESIYFVYSLFVFFLCGLFVNIFLCAFNVTHFLVFLSDV
jgi:hypothetical protein